MSDYVVIYSTFPDKKLAGEVAHALVEKELVACVNIFPEVTSVYKWQGVLETIGEIVITAKTRKPLFNKVKDLILEMHSYDTPCIVALDIAQGDEKFLNWIQKETINP